MKQWIFIVFLSITTAFSCNKEKVNTPAEETPESENIVKPSGIFSSSGASTVSVINHSATRGVLIRASWKQLEPTEGNFDFSAIDKQIKSIKDNNKKYSLGILAGGIGSPEWLISGKGIQCFNYLFRGDPYKLPPIWDTAVQSYLGKLADKLAEIYGNDSSLVLVYIPQMTANGIEGHMNGFDQTAFSGAGYNENKWIEASVKNAKKFALAFRKKALAFEVHDLFGSSAPASAILNSLWSDPELDHRVGAAMWWISGKDSYQPGLLTILKNFPGDIYCQVIDRSDNAAKFPEEDYSKVFEQAKILKARYIEPWEYEFSTDKWDHVFQDFNVYADGLKKY